MLPSRTAFNVFFKWALAGSAFALAGCEGPQSTLQPDGPAAQTVAWLWWGMLAVSVVVTVFVTVLWLWAMRPRDNAPSQTDARRLQRRLLLGGGLVLPLSAIIVLLGFGIPAGHSMLPLAVDGEPPLRIEVTARQWWWEVHYPQAGVTTANELHLPAGRPVDMHVTSEDVIHSFWVPRLGGKIDMIPGRVNVLRLSANQPGQYRAQCAEFCGLGHAHMHMPVTAHAAEDFDAWLARRQQPVVDQTAHAPAIEAFQAHCAQCHSVSGISEGQGGPDLTTAGARQPDILTWLNEHTLTPPPTPAPDHSTLAPDHLADIAAWLRSIPASADGLPQASRHEKSSHEEPRHEETRHEETRHEETRHD